MTEIGAYLNKIICGDCLDVMREMSDNSIDAIVTDPPYGLEFMGKEWDKLLNKDRHVDYASCRNAHGPNEYKAGLEMQLWHSKWVKQAFRILKPGASMLVMGGTRTFHRLMVAIEDSGFIIKDCLMWIYGSGFPKAQDLGKMIDKRVKRKSEYYELAEFIKKARIKSGKSMNDIAILFPSKTGGITGCVWNWENAKNVPTMEQWQILKEILGLHKNFDWLIEQETKRWEEAEREKIGEINKARAEGQKLALPTMGAKTEYIDIDITIPSTDLAKHWDGFKIGGIKPAYEPIVWAVKPPEGSYIDNVLKWGVGAVNVDECRVGTSENEVNARKDKGNKLEKRPSQVLSTKEGTSWSGNKGRFPANIILDEEAGRAMDEQSGNLQSGAKHGAYDGWGHDGVIYGDTKPYIQHCKASNGGASRFFYCAKASKGERESHNDHPTVKPLKLFEWLIMLITREGQIVLDPFFGSGSTGLACNISVRKFIGIEKESDYCKLAEKRLSQEVLF